MKSYGRSLPALYCPFPYRHRCGQCRWKYMPHHILPHLSIFPVFASLSFLGLSAVPYVASLSLPFYFHFLCLIFCLLYISNVCSDYIPNARSCQEIIKKSCRKNLSNSFFIITFPVVNLSHPRLFRCIFYTNRRNPCDTGSAFRFLRHPDQHKSARSVFAFHP